MTDRWATFDCYGTLIDWFGGVRATLVGLWPAAPIDDLMATYHRMAYNLDAPPEKPAEVGWRGLEDLAAAHGLTVPAGRERALMADIPNWPVFPEVPAALREVKERGWKMAILTNVNQKYLATSLPKLGVEFDVLITPDETGSMKPAPGHWDLFFQQTGADRSRQVHVAASWFHDLRYTSPNGMRCAWINRRGEDPPYERTAELATLTGLADVLDRIQPA